MVEGRRRANIRIRPTAAGDAAAVESILRASYPELLAPFYPPDLLRQALPLMTRAQPALLTSGTYFLAEAAEEPVGCGGWSWAAPGSSEASEGLAHLRHFATAEAWAGRGIGRKIYRRCEAQAVAAGVRRFLCHSSLNGEAFYATLGFRRIGLVEASMTPDLSMPCVLMCRDLDRPPPPPSASLPQEQE